MEYAVLDDEGVEVYSFDGEKMIKNVFLSFPVQDALGISTRVSDSGVAVLDEESVRVYHFDGSGMSENPFLKILGVESPLSMITIKNDDVAVLDSEGNVKGYSFSGDKMVENGFISLDGKSLKGTMMASGKCDYEYRVLDKDEKNVVYYGVGEGGIEENPFLKIMGLENPVYVSVKKGTYDTVVIDDGDIKYFQFDGQGMIENYMLRLSKDEYGLEEPLAVAINPFENGVAVVDGEDIRYFQFDGEKMVENERLKVAGVSVNAGGYIGGKVYQTKSIRTEEPVGYLYIKVRDKKPDKTDIVYEVSLDGGVSWESAVLGEWMEVRETDNIVVRAFLLTEDKSVAPEIYDLTVYGVRVVVTYLEDMRYVESVPTSVFPVGSGSGYYIGFYIFTGGVVDDLNVVLYEEESGIDGMYSKEVDMAKSGRKWRAYTYTDERLVAGDCVGVRITSSGFCEELYICPFIEIRRSIYDDIGDRLSVELKN